LIGTFLMAWKIYNSLERGYVGGRGSISAIQEEPILFWLFILFYCVAGVFLASYLIYCLVQFFRKKS